MSLDVVLVKLYLSQKKIFYTCIKFKFSFLSVGAVSSFFCR